MGYWLEDSPPGSMAFLHNTQTKCGDKTLAADLSIYFKDKRRHNGCSITVSIWIQGIHCKGSVGMASPEVQEKRLQ